jgi:hypothetical protein
LTYHFRPRTKFRTLTTPSACEDVEGQKFSFIAGENAKWHSYFRRQFDTKLKILLFSNPAMAFLNVYQK